MQITKPIIWLVIQVCVIGVMLFQASVSIADGPQNILVVVNEESLDSLTVANHYIQLRNIPPCNVVYVKGIKGWKTDGEESVNSEIYRTCILDPVQAAMKDRGIEKQIDCIAYSVGFPTRVVCLPELGRYLKSTGKTRSKIYHQSYVSLNSATFFQEGLFSDTPVFWDTHSNWYSQPTTKTKSFSSQLSWSRTGESSTDETDGKRYRLSVVLAVVRERGSTVAQALKQLSRAASADGSNPEGIFFFANHSDPRSRTRKSQYAGAASALQQLGFEAEVSQELVPKGKRVIGATLGSPSINWKKSRSEFAPGAICDNFTSYGGWFSPGKQTQLTHFLNHGAAGGVGTIYEPYTIPNKIPTAYAHVHYARGCTFAESIYQTVQMPYQLLVVGDPLCRPFARFSTFDIEGVVDGAVVNKDIQLIFKQISGPPIGRYEVYLDGILRSTLGVNEPANIPMADLAGGYHEIRVAGIDDSQANVTTTRTVKFAVKPPESNTFEFKLDVKNRNTEPTDRISVSCQYPKHFPPKTNVKIWQNSRVVGELGRSGDAIDLTVQRLGVGKTKIYPVAKVAGDLIYGPPLEVSFPFPASATKR